MRRCLIFCVAFAILAGGCTRTGGEVPRTAPNRDTVNVTESEKIGQDLACTDLASCDKDYKGFLYRAERFAHPVTDAELKEQFALGFRYFQHEIPYTSPEGVDEVTLRERLIDILNIRFLLDGLDARPLQAVVTKTDSIPEGVRKDILFQDPWVGSFKAVLLTPAGRGPFPSILIIPGHSQSADIFLTDFPQVREFVRKGYALLLLTERVNNADKYEDALARAFLSKGFSLLGIRIYESLLCHKYLRFLYGQDEPIGLLGHSGGAVSNNVLIRIEKRFFACVTDCTGNFLYEYKKELIDEALPLMHVYHFLINDFAAAPAPVLKVSYDYKDQWGEIIAFFDLHRGGGAK